MIDINQIFYMLSGDRDEATQATGIREAQNIEYLSILFQPIESKSVWENCARVLASKTDDMLAMYQYQMFEWLQDMNWPGAQIIFDRLLAMPASMLSTPFQYSLKKAQALNDEPWTYWLLLFQQKYESRSGIGGTSLCQTDNLN